MSQNLLQDILQGFVNEENLYRWLISDVTDNVLSATYNCTKTDFIFYYLNFVRSQTNRFLKNDENPNESNDRSRNYTGSTHFSNSAHDSNTSLLQNESYIEEGTNIQEKNIIGPNKIIHNSLHIDNAFNENAFSPVPHSGNTKLNESSGSVYFSTPNDQKKRNNSFSSKSYSKSQKSIERVSINFGDYIQSASSKKHKHHSANKSRSINTSNEKSDLTCSVDQNTTENSYSKDITGTPESSRSNLDSQFPALGERLSFQKSNSASKINRSKRIKPTSLNFSDCDINKSDSIKTSFNDINERQQNCNSSCNNFQMERSILRNEKDFIKKQFENSKHIKTIFINPKEKSTVVKVSDPGDILQVTRRKELDILANIYNVILNNNLVVNFFSELNFIFSLLNVEKIDDQTDNSDLFPTFHNCIYFCIKILREQKQFFILLDNDTLRVLSDNKRIQNFNHDLNLFLKCVLKRKSVLPTPTDGSLGNKNNVCFQSETDNRENFTSDQTFRAFRKQRDLFYDMLRNWESMHNTPNYSFALYDSTMMMLFNVNGTLIPNKMQQRKYNEHNEFGRINVIYNNVCNMAHLARLFVKQLLASCESEHTEFNQLLMEHLPNVDPNRLSRLSNRFTTNATTTSDVTAFVGVQEFFRDFIQYSDNHTFLEHLKIVMSSEILDINSACLEFKSSYILITNMDHNTEIENKQTRSIREDDMQKSLELVKRISSLRLLSKFLGFTTDLPYNNNGHKMKSLTFNELNKIEVCPLLDLNSIIDACSDDFSTLIVIQWITMYLSMLNEETLITDKYCNILMKLFKIYAKSLILNDCKGFTIYFKYCFKIILGNFFDLPNVSINFYEWRFSTPLKELNLEYDFEDQFHQIKIESKEMARFKSNDSLFNALLPSGIKFLEKILYQNVPTLNSLKSVIKGFKTYNKGRIRHVTPFTHQSSSKEKDEKKIQIQLENNFFNNHPSSVKKTVEFVTDRIFSVIIKEIISKDITQAKEAASLKFLNIKTTNKLEAETQLISLCTESIKELMAMSNLTIQKIVDERVKVTIVNLLPIEMLASVKSMCAKICKKRVSVKCQAWLKEKASDIKVLCKDIDGQVEQIIKNNMMNDKLKSNADSKTEIISEPNIDINRYIEHVGPSEILIDAQDILCTIISEEYPTEKPLTELYTLLNNIEECIKVWTSILNMCIKVLATLTVDIAIAIVCHYPNQIKDTLPKFLRIWKHDTFSTFIKIGDKNSISLDNSLQVLTEKADVDYENQNTDDYVFLKVVSARTITLISESRNFEEVWSSYSLLVIFLLDENFLTMDSFGEECLKLLRLEWSNVTLHHLSQNIKIIMKQSQNAKHTECSEITLLLEWMSDFCDDIDL